tara:strand:- start:407 stop:931 length:525 start_codon:yes stop_codon:yes gene_type:complete
VKKYNFIIIFFIILITSNISYSQNIVIADLDKIVKSSETGKKIITYFSEENKKLLDEFKINENKFKKKERTLISQKNLLSAEEYLKKVDELKKEVNNFNIDSNIKLKELNNFKNKILRLFRNEINKILQEFSEKNKIDLIISSEQILIGKSNIDVTNDLLNIVNKKITNFEIKK